MSLTWPDVFRAFDEVGVPACFHLPDSVLYTRGPNDGPKNPELKAIIRHIPGNELDIQRTIQCSALTWTTAKGKRLRRLPLHIAREIDCRHPIGERTGYKGKVTVKYVSPDNGRLAVKEEVYRYTNPSENADQEATSEFIIRINTTLED